MEPSQQTTLAILLGASKWPNSSLQASPAFARSANKIRDYFSRQYLLGLPSENFLDLFDQKQNSPLEVDQAIGDFLDKRIALMKQAGTPARDLLFYYIGHGVFASTYDQAYHLAIHSTSDGNLRSSAVAMAALADTLKAKARHLRRLVILDCCFAAESFKYMQSAPDQVAIRQTISAFEEKSMGRDREFPKRGTTLLCSSGHKEPSLILPDESGTMFSEALIRALYLGNERKRDRTYLSLYELKVLTEDALESLTEGTSPIPFLSSPDQSDGDVAAVPLFPNFGASEVELSPTVVNNFFKYPDLDKVVKMAEELRIDRFDLFFALFKVFTGDISNLSSNVISTIVELLTSSLAGTYQSYLVNFRWWETSESSALSGASGRTVPSLRAESAGNKTALGTPDLANAPLSTAGSKFVSRFGRPFGLTPSISLNEGHREWNEFTPSSTRLINLQKGEILLKIVYYGIGLCGKTENLHSIRRMVDPQDVGDVVSIDTETERTLYFDVLPLKLGEIQGFHVHAQLYTVPGQILYQQTRISVIREADCVIFVADSQASKLQENIECWNELQEELRRMGKDPANFPLIMQWNKRNLQDILPVSVLEKYLNPYRVPSFEAVAETGKGVMESLSVAINAALKSLML